MNILRNILGFLAGVVTFFITSWIMETILKFVIASPFICSYLGFFATFPVFFVTLLDLMAGMWLGIFVGDKIVKPNKNGRRIGMIIFGASITIYSLFTIIVTINYAGYSSTIWGWLAVAIGGVWLITRRDVKSIVAEV